LQRFAVIYVPLLVATGLLIGVVYWSESQSEQTVLKLGQTSQVRLVREIIQADLRSVVTDLMLLAEGDTLQRALDENSSEAQARLWGDFAVFSRNKGLYDQVRLLDEQGQERVRVNLVDGQPQIVAPEKLQNKADRYYFRETFELAPGEVFVSPFDLNVEEGQIEQPPKPTIRFGTPVVDSQGRKRGIVIVNFLGENLLAKIRNATAGSEGRGMLLNDQGYWLYGPRPEQQWAFMYPEREKLRFRGPYPLAWQELTASDGQWVTPRGMFTAESVEPVAGAGYRWYVVSHVEPDAMFARARRLRTGLVWLFVALAVVLAAVCWYLARTMLAHHQAREQLLQSARLAAIGEAMTGLAHESRNALQRSQAGLEMVRRRLDDRPEARQLLDEVQQAQHYLHELYEEVRGWAAPLKLEREPVDLGQLVDETFRHVSELDADAQRHDVLTHRGEVADRHSDVDRRAIGQVFRNILENARAAAPGSGIEVHWADDRLNNQPALTVCIRDHGPGIPPEQQQRIFDPFYTTRSRGTGLGMAIARRIVEAHGGRISVGNHAGGGAEVVVTLPRGE